VRPYRSGQRPERSYLNPPIRLRPDPNLPSMLPPPSPLLTINPTSLSAIPSVNLSRPVPVAGPSSQSATPSQLSAPLSPPPVMSAKRRRQYTATDIDPSSPAETGPIRTARRDKDGPKKKKATRACFRCQKAHLTCDDCTYRLTLTFNLSLRSSSIT